LKQRLKMLMAFIDESSLELIAVERNRCAKYPQDNKHQGSPFRALVACGLIFCSSGKVFCHITRSCTNSHAITAPAYVSSPINVWIVALCSAVRMIDKTSAYCVRAVHISLSSTRQIPQGLRTTDREPPYVHLGLPGIWASIMSVFTTTAA